MGLVYVDNVKYYKRKGEHVFSYRYRVSNDSVGWSKVTKSFDSFDSCRDFVYGFLDYEVSPVPYSFYAKLIGLSGGDYNLDKAIFFENLVTGIDVYRIGDGEHVYLCRRLHLDYFNVYSVSFSLKRTESMTSSFLFTQAEIDSLMSQNASLSNYTVSFYQSGYRGS